MADPTPTSGNHQELVSTGKPLATGAIFRMTTPDGTQSHPWPSSLSDLSASDCVGFISEDGVENGIETSTEDKKVWGGNIVMSALDEFKETYKFTMVETSPNVMKAIWGDSNVAARTSGGTVGLTDMTVDHTADAFQQVSCWVIVTLYMDTALEMHVIPKGQLSALDSVSYNDTDLIGYPATISALAGGYGDNPNATSRHYFFAQSS